MQKRKGRQGHGGKRKRGRSREECESYRKRGQREKNKALRLALHRARHPNDLG